MSGACLYSLCVPSWHGQGQPDLFFIPLYAVVVEAEELYWQWHEVPEDIYTNCDVLNQRNMPYPSLRS